MKTNKNKKLIAIGLMLAMFVLYGVLPLPNGAKAVNSLTDASDTLTDSDIGESGVSHIVEFTTATEIPNNGYTLVTLHSDFSDVGVVGNITCSNGTAVSPGGKVARCTHDAGLVAAATPLTVTIAGNTNPGSDGFRRIDIGTYTSGGELLDRVSVMVYIIQDIYMSATVDPILTFTINGVALLDAKTVNGISCNAPDGSTASTTPFGTLGVNATTTVCQRLNVTTNADDGYVVTVEQDNELLSDSGSNINSFDNSPNGTGSTTAHTWVSPTNTLDQYHTYGHMGVTSDDQDLLDVNPDLDYYNGGVIAKYAGLNGTDPLLVMAHDGPSDGIAQNIGEAFVAYSAEIASLQEAGDYESTLTYIVTPTY